MQRLDHREHVPALGDLAAAVDLAEGSVAQDGAIRRERLPEDLLAVGDEQQREVLAGPGAELAVVERGNDGLAGPGRRDDEVAMTVVPFALGRQRVEHPLLMRVRADIEVGERDRRALAERASVVLAQRLRKLVAVDVRVVVLEVLGRPVALERHPDAIDDVRSVDRRQPHVPLKAIEQGGVGEVRRADEGGAQAGVALEQPGLRVQLRRARVERDSDALRRSRTSSSTARFSVAPM